MKRFSGMLSRTRLSRAKAGPTTDALSLRTYKTKTKNNIRFKTSVSDRNSRSGV